MPPPCEDENEGSLLQVTMLSLLPPDTPLREF